MDFNIFWSKKLKREVIADGPVEGDKFRRYLCKYVLCILMSNQSEQIMSVQTGLYVCSYFFFICLILMPVYKKDYTEIGTALWD